ncbi:MAG: hypothetical protein Q9216_006267 [Gyalolechia sp. 2 TL-2023]
MKSNKEAGGLMPRNKRPSISQTLFGPVIAVLNKTFSLLIPRDWSRRTLKRILNDEEHRDDLLKLFIESELTKMNTTGVTAALVAGVISGSFSWYNIDDTTWVTKSVWYSGLVLAIASVASSAIHTAAFLRMRCSHDVLDRFKVALGKKQKGQGPWQPHILAPYVLGGPTLHLKLAVLMFLVGLFYELWRAAVAADLLWGSDDLKIAVIVTIVGGFVMMTYIFSITTLVHHSMQTDG